jgi:hypothetical protein
MMSDEIEVGSAAEDVRYVSGVLEATKESGLEAEVITWALYAMRRDPKLTLAEAMQEGFDEWVK